MFYHGGHGEHGGGRFFVHYSPTRMLMLNYRNLKHSNSQFFLRVFRDLQRLVRRSLGEGASGWLLLFV